MPSNVCQTIKGFLVNCYHENYFSKNIYLAPPLMEKIIKEKRPTLIHTLLQERWKDPTTEYKKYHWKENLKIHFDK